MVLLTHPTGNTFVRALLDELEASRHLGLFATTLNIRGDSAWLKCLPRGVRAELSRRSYDLAPGKIAGRPGREIARLIAGRLGLAGVIRQEHGWACVDAVYHDLDRWVARSLPRWTQDRQIGSVYAYEDGALETFRAAAATGCRRVYDLPIAYWATARKLLDEEAQRLPAWEPTLVGTRDSEAKLERKTAEVELAELVVCPSQFVLNSLPAGIRATKRCLVAEFGSPNGHQTIGPRARNARLRVLFAGSMTQRKGLADVFAALKLMGRSDVELVVLGSPIVSMDFYRSQGADFTHEPPRPHAEVLRLMAGCDVFVLPSIVEGRALVQQEAMSCGLPLIATANAGGEDLIDEGRTGFLVSIRSPACIAEKLNWLADHREALPEMSKLARQKAAGLTWPAYAGKIVREIVKLEKM